MESSLNLGAMTAEVLMGWAINIALAIGIFLVGRIVIRAVLKLVRGFLERGEFDQILINFLLSILHAVLLLIVVVAALDQLGIDTTSMIALLGAAGVAVGIALKDSLGNFASGVMMVIFRPFKAGDYVEIAGTDGTVESINIFNTTLTSIDNKEIIVPNGQILTNVIKNYSARDTRRVDLIFGISYDDDILQAKKILEDLLKNDSRVLPDPAPTVGVAELGDNSVNLYFRPWVNKEDYWPLRADMLERTKVAFDQAGISIPYPQMQLHTTPADPPNPDSGAD